MFWFMKAANSTQAELICEIVRKKFFEPDDFESGKKNLHQLIFLLLHDWDVLFSFSSSTNQTLEI